jgi:hypothetical protein
MSWENTACPCGGKKLTDTMLCSPCEQAFATHRDRLAMWDAALPFQSRREAAMRVLAMSRKRSRSLLPLSYS